MRTSDLLTIGELAARSGVAPSALRYYESRGLIAATRSEGNQRRYQRATLRRVAFVRAAQRVGLSLEEVAGALATLPNGRIATRADWERLAWLERASGGPARRARASPDEAHRLHPMWLPVAAPVRAVQPGGRRGRARRGRAGAAG